MEQQVHSIVVGGGAAGFFAALTARAANPEKSIYILERTGQFLGKVKISGGGRCNVTHACFEPRELVKYYPRGSKALLGPFTRFGPRDTVAWFAERGVELKTEGDGRMFPVTDSSQTIIQCLVEEAKCLGVELCTGFGVKAIERSAHGFVLATESETFQCEKLLLATGSHPQGHAWAQRMGHTIVSAVPSLFTFNIPSSSLLDLSGISVEQVVLTLECYPEEQCGPLLLTHWGFSGPAVLKFSAWAARELHACGYHTTVFVRWVPARKLEEVQAVLKQHKERAAQRAIAIDPPYPLPRNLWSRLAKLSGITEEARWGSLSQKSLCALAEKLFRDPYLIEGKTTYKQEFVTAGGVNLDEVNFRTMESKCTPGLYFAGEILDIDGVTGGFNFQNAWTTGYIAGHSLAD